MRQLAVLVSYSKMKLLPLDRIINLCKKALRMSIHTHTQGSNCTTFSILICPLGAQQEAIKIQLDANAKHHSFCYTLLHVKENSRNCLCSKISRYDLLDILAYYRDAGKFTTRVLHPLPDQTTPAEPMTWSAMEKVGNRENLMRKTILSWKFTHRSESKRKFTNPKCKVTNPHDTSQSHYLQDQIFRDYGLTTFSICSVKKISVN